MNDNSFFRCTVCGYIHQGASPPAVCPVCGVGREAFVPQELPPVRLAVAADRWRCEVCGYEHVGAQPPEICPVCGAGRELFTPIGGEAPPAGDREGGGHGRVVVVGSGIAGLTAAEQARRVLPQGEVVLVDREPGLPYYRLNLTRLLAGEIDREGLLIHPASWYEEQRIERLVDTVSGLDRPAKRLKLGRGPALPYDTLVLACGGHPFIPPIPGADRPGVFTLRQVGDAEQILDRCRQTGGPCLCVGGGLLGLETAGALARQGVPVTVLEGFGWLLPRQLPEPAGRLLADHVRGQGIGVRTGVKVVEIQGDPEVTGVKLASGETLPAGLVVIAAGVRANTQLPREAGLAVGAGVLVDDHLRTTDAAIFAAGDGVEHRGAVSGIWPASFAQGYVAGSNAASGQAEYRPLPPSNQLKVLAVSLFSIGTVVPPDGGFEQLEVRGEETFLRLVTRDGALAGACLYGDTRLAGRVKEAVEGGEQLAGQPWLLEAHPWSRPR